MIPATHSDLPGSQISCRLLRGAVVHIKAEHRHANMLRGVYSFIPGQAANSSYNHRVRRISYSCISARPVFSINRTPAPRERIPGLFSVPASSRSGRSGGICGSKEWLPVPLRSGCPVKCRPPMPKRRCPWCRTDFMPRGAQSRNMHCLHINRQNARTLSGVYHKEPALCGDSSRRQAPADAPPQTH